MCYLVFTDINAVKQTNLFGLKMSNAKMTIIHTFFSVSMTWLLVQTEAIQKHA